jgi:PAS domain S-box-containing protein
VSAQRRILLVSRSQSALGELEGEASLNLVRAHDTSSAMEQLQEGRFACALLDLDGLGEAATDLLSSVRRLHPGLPTVGYGQAQARPSAQLLDVPRLAAPVTLESLEAVLLPPRAAAAAIPDANQEELRRRVSQLTTLYQIGRAISESRNWTEALDYFLATLCEYLDVRGAGILLYSRENSVLAPRRVLSIPNADVGSCVQALLTSFPTRHPSPEIHALECFLPGRGVSCRGHTRSWRFTVLPLLYRRTPLGFLLLDKQRWRGPDFAAELFFLQTIQTILTEEVANAVHLSRLVDLKNFNEGVLESIESGVVTANEQGEIHFANRLARQILGIGADEETLPPQHFDAVFQVSRRDAPRSLLATVLESGDGRCHFEGRLRRLDGAHVPIRMRTSRIVNPSDSHPLILVAFEDLTQHRLLEEQLRRADRLRSLGELSAAIAHEVRNPLQGISLTLSNLKQHLQPGAAHYVDVMFSEMERLNGIVGNILSFARPAPPQPRSASLAEICRRAIDIARERASQRETTVELEPAPQDATCEVDEGQILQVVLNIVMNAIDASPPGSTVRVRVVESDAPLLPGAAPGPWFRIEVQDEGAGIREDERDKLFDPFFTTKPEGTGLGLSVSQKIIEEHRGVIHVRSEPEVGSRFIVELPREFECGFASVAAPAHERGA